MKAFPMFIRTTGRRVVILGDGEQAAQKLRLILKTDADIVLACSKPEAELSEENGTVRCTHPGLGIEVRWTLSSSEVRLFQGSAK